MFFDGRLFWIPTDSWAWPFMDDHIFCRQSMCAPRQLEYNTWLFLCLESCQSLLWRESRGGIIHTWRCEARGKHGWTTLHHQKRDVWFYSSIVSACLLREWGGAVFFLFSLEYSSLSSLRSSFSLWVFGVVFTREKKNLSFPSKNWAVAMAGLVNVAHKLCQKRC